MQARSYSGYNYAHPTFVVTWGDVYFGLFYLSTGVMVLTQSVMIVMVWVLIWAFARHAAEGNHRSGPLMFWIGIVMMYPTTATAFGALHQHATVRGAFLAFALLTAGPRLIAAMARSKWCALIGTGWIGWGTLAYGGVFFAWLIGTFLRLPLPPELDALPHATSAVWAAVPVIAAVSAAALPILGIRCPDDANRLIRALTTAVLIVTLLSFVQALLGLRFVATTYEANPNRLAAVSEADPNGYARMLLVPTIILFAAVLVRFAGVRHIRLASAAVGLAVVSVLLTLSRTGYVSLTAGLFVLVALNIRRGRTVAIALLVTAVVGAGLWLGDAYDTFTAGDRMSLDNFRHRLGLYELIWRIVKENPWFGVWPGGYFDALRDAQYASPTLVSAHNMFLGIAVEWGLPMAVLLVLALAGAFVHAGVGLRRLRVTLPGARPVQALLQGSVALSVALGIHGLTENVPPDLVFFAFGLAVTAQRRLVPLVNAGACQ